jgi:lysophospholipase L1-like esterase
VKADGVNGSKSSDGVTRLPGVLAAHAEAQYVLIMFGTNDAYWVQRPSGLGLSPGQPGYAGSYKDYMSQITGGVLAAGKEPILAKAPPFAGVCSGSTPVEVLNALVQEYNQVVDELVAEFEIVAPPPDFYSYFSTHAGEFFDDCHPNGVGYQSMANLWRDALVSAP